MMMPIFVFTRLHHGLAVAERALDPTSTNVLIVCSVVRTRAEVALRRLRLVTCSASVAPDVQRRHAGSITKHHLAGACVSTGCALKFANSRPVFDQASLLALCFFRWRWRSVLLGTVRLDFFQKIRNSTAAASDIYCESYIRLVKSLFSLVFQAHSIQYFFNWASTCQQEQTSFPYKNTLRPCRTTLFPMLLDRS